MAKPASRVPHNRFHGTPSSFHSRSSPSKKSKNDSLCRRISSLSQTCLKKGVAATFSTARAGFKAATFVALTAAFTGMTLAELAFINRDAYSLELQELAAFYNLDLEELGKCLITRTNSPTSLIVLPLLCSALNAKLLDVATFLQAPMYDNCIRRIKQAEDWTMKKLGL